MIVIYLGIRGNDEGKARCSKHNMPAVLISHITTKSRVIAIIWKENYP